MDKKYNILFLNPVPLIINGIMSGFQQNGWNSYVISKEDHVLGKSPEVQVNMINKYVEKYKIDVIFCDFGVGPAYKEIFNYCESKGICEILWGIEDIPSYKIWLDQTINYCHYYLTTTEELIPYAKSKYNKDINLLMFGVNQNYHKPVPPNKCKYTCDIALVGNNYSSRYSDFNEFIYPLITNNYNINIWGGDWWIDESRPVNLCGHPEIYKGYIKNHETQELYSTCSIALGLNCNRESNSQQSMRFAEVMGIGNAIFVSPWSQAQENYLGKSGEYAFFPKTQKEMIENIDYILQMSDNDRLQMAKKAQEFVYMNHSYKNKVENIVNILEGNVL